LEAAFVIQQNHLAVVAHKQCDSACIIVLMSGAKRFADWDLKMGFHIFSLHPSFAQSSDEASFSTWSKEVYRYLVARGVPQEVIDQAEAIGTKTFVWVPSIKLAETGALTALLDGGKIVSTNAAKWLYVERTIRRRADGEALADLLFSIRSNSPNVADREAGRLYTALEAKDITTLDGVIAEVASMHR
jgi:hypothetical protein